MAFSGYILGIVGVIILGVVIDLMLIEGQMQKYIKSIFVIFVIFVIIAPIPELFKAEITLPVSQTAEINLDEKLMQSINLSKSKNLESDIISHFSANGVSGVLVKVEFDSKSMDFVPKKISLNIKNLVIENNYLNINKYEVLKGLILEVVACSEDIIEFYE